MKKSDLPDRMYQFLTNPWLIAVPVFLLLITAAIGNMEVDEGIWNYIGWLWVKKGIPPYIGAVENKTPAIFMLFAVSNMLFGINFWFPRALGILAMAGTSAVVYLIGCKLHNRLAGALGMILCGFTFSWRVVDSPSPAQTESFMILFTALAILMIVKIKERQNLFSYKRDIFLSGLLAGIAICFKQIAVTSAAGLFLFYYVTPDRSALSSRNVIKDAGLMLSGIILVTVISLIPLLISHVSFGEYLNGAWLILLKPGSSSSPNSSAPNMLYRLIRFLVMWVWKEMHLFIPLVLLFIMQRKEMTAHKIPLWAIASWLGLEFLGVNSSGNILGHQIKQVIPPLALASGISISLWLETTRREWIRKNQARAAVLTIIILGVLWLPYPLWLGNIKKSGRSVLGYSLKRNKFVMVKKSDSAGYRDLGLWIKNHTTDNDYVRIFAEPQILAYAERRSSSRYIYLCNYDNLEQEMTHNLQDKPPEIILIDRNDSSEYFEELERIIRPSYKLLFVRDTFNVFKKIPN